MSWPIFCQSAKTLNCFAGCAGINYKDDNSGHKLARTISGFDLKLPFFSLASAGQHIFCEDVEDQVSMLSELKSFCLCKVQKTSIFFAGWRRHTF